MLRISNGNNRYHSPTKILEAVKEGKLIREEEVYNESNIKPFLSRNSGKVPISSALEHINRQMDVNEAMQASGDIFAPAHSHGNWYKPSIPS